VRELVANTVTNAVTLTAPVALIAAAPVVDSDPF
jgi:hypothetical protein